MENVKKEYFWEYGYMFGMYLKKVFGDEYERFYSMNGAGIYNLIHKDNKIYEVKLTQSKKMVVNDDKKTTDKTKNEIVDAIVSNLKNDYAVNGGKFITFKLDNFIFKLEVIKKLHKPE